MTASGGAAGRSGRGRHWGMAALAALAVVTPSIGVTGGATSARAASFAKAQTSSLVQSDAPPGAHAIYYGGPVISNVDVTEVLYGDGTFTPEVSSTGTQTIAAFYAGITNSAYLDWLTEYSTNVNADNGDPGTNQVIGRGTFAGQVTITPSPPNNGGIIDDASIQDELKAQIESSALPMPNADTLFAVYFPANKTIRVGSSLSGVDFCAYHGTVAASGAIPEFAYSVLPDFTTGGMASHCGAGTRYQNETAVSSHELIEAVTDPAAGLATTTAPPLAWYDVANGEVADICNGAVATVVGGDGAIYTVAKGFSNRFNDCIVTSPPVVSITSGPNPSAPGPKVTFTITVRSGLPVAKIRGTALIYDGDSFLGTAHVSAGAGVFRTAKLTVGQHQITAVFTPARTSAPVTSDVYVHTVDVAETATTLATTAAIHRVGRTVRLTASVDRLAPATRKPLGAVEFYDGPTLLATVPLTASGRAVYRTTNLTIGTHNLTAAFVGSPTDATSTSDPLAVTVSP